VTTRRALSFAFLDRYASLVIGIGSSMVLARLLTPSQVGAYAVAMVLLSLAATVRDLGVGQYLVLEKDLTTDRIRAVWAVQLGFGTLLAAAIYVVSGPLAIFFSEPEVGTILTVLAVSYLFNPLGSITYAWLIREMRFEAIAIMRFSSTLSGAMVSVYLAWKGHGPVSMAWGGLVSTMVNATVSIKFRPANYPWLPGLREVRRVLSLGTKVTSTALLNTVHMGAPEFLLGKFQGLAAAGFFSRGNGLVAMFNRLITDAVQTVALSLFAKERRAGNGSGASFAASIAYMTVLSYSFGLFMLLLAFPIVRLLYGTQWDDSVELTRVLCLGIAIGSPVPMCIAALMAADRASRVVRITAGMAALSVLACAVAAHFGAIYVCFAIVSTTAISTVVWMRAAIQVVGTGNGAMHKAMARSAAVAVSSAIGPAAVVWVYGWRPTEVMMVLGLGSTTCILGFLAGVYSVKHPIVTEIERLRARLPRLRAN
jgi:O-antigen/teichoic acid export membrane protein